MKTAHATAYRNVAHAEKRQAAKELLRIGYAIRTVERMTGLPYITVYRIGNPATKH